MRIEDCYPSYIDLEDEDCIGTEIFHYEKPRQPADIGVQRGPTPSQQLGLGPSIEPFLPRGESEDLARHNS